VTKSTVAQAKWKHMNDPKMEQSVNNPIRPESIEAIQSAKSGQAGTPSQPLTQATRKKRWVFLGLIALVLLCAIPVIGYLRQSETAKRLEGLSLAFCAIAWGGFLIKHFIQVVTEEDELEEQLLNAEPTPTEQQRNLAAPLPEAGPNKH
jgi:hypothetical protein